MSTEYWSKPMTGERTLTVEIRDVLDPKPLFGSQGGPLAAAELVYPDGSAYPYSTVEKVRSMLTKRGFRRSVGERLVQAGPDVDDEPPRRAI